MNHSICAYHNLLSLISHLEITLNNEQRDQIIGWLTEETAKCPGEARFRLARLRSAINMLRIFQDEGHNPMNVPTLIPTEEQAAIIRAAISTNDNLLISALAGSSKTTTLEMIAHALPGVPIFCIAFNKRVVEEMVRRLPSNAVCKTVNSIGHTTFQTAIGRRLKIDTRKSYNLLKQAIDERPRQSRNIDFGATLKAISLAKLNGYIPEGSFPSISRLCGPEFVDELDDEVDLDLVNTVLVRSIRAAYDGLCDFDDQIYMPTLFGGTFPRYPLVLVDETQDLSPLNIELVTKLATTRLIAVGDPNQSIYAFRGADTASMPKLKARFNMRELPLSISFRCPRAIVELARARAPHMQYPEWAAEGSVNRPLTWSQDDVPEGAAIVCRNNAPLFSIGLRLLQRGRGIKLVGTDIGSSMVRFLRRFGDVGLSQADLLSAIDAWEAETLSTRKRRKASTADRAECFRVFAKAGKNLGEAAAYAEHLFAVRRNHSAPLRPQS